jgi:peptide deformylase
MSIKPIIIIPDPILREVSKSVERVDDDLQLLLDDMLETMYDAPGIGLAAIQIGIPLRIVTVDVGERSIDEERVADDADDTDDTDDGTVTVSWDSESGTASASCFIGTLWK